MLQRWNKTVVLEKIRNLHRQGRKLNAAYARAHYRTLVWATYKYVGGWRQAVEAAGFDYEAIRRYKAPTHWNKRMIIKVIQELHKAGVELHSNYVQQHRRPLYGAAIRYFGGWKQAVCTAGFEYAEIRQTRWFRSWRKELIVAEIRARKRRGLAINSFAVSRDDSSLYRIAQRYFGKRGWQKALRMAGFDPVLQNPQLFWTRQRVLKKVREFWASKQPLYGKYLCYHGFGGLIEAGRRYFGSWRKTILAAGIDYEKVRAVRWRWWTKQRTLAEIRRLEREGVRLNHKSIQRSHADLIHAAIKNFGSWSQAVERAGINYRLHSFTWSYKAWLRTLRPWQVQELEQQTLRRAKVRRMTR